MADIRHPSGHQGEPKQVYEAINSIAVSGIVGTPGMEATTRPAVLILYDSAGLQVVESGNLQLVQWKCLRGPAEWVGTIITFDLRYKQGPDVSCIFTHANGRARRVHAPLQYQMGHLPAKPARLAGARRGPARAL